MRRAPHEFALQAMFHLPKNIPRFAIRCNNRSLGGESPQLFSANCGATEVVPFPSNASLLGRFLDFAGTRIGYFPILP